MQPQKSFWTLCALRWFHSSRIASTGGFCFLSVVRAVCSFCSPGPWIDEVSYLYIHEMANTPAKLEWFLTPVCAAGARNFLRSGSLLRSSCFVWFHMHFFLCQFLGRARQSRTAYMESCACRHGGPPPYPNPLTPPLPQADIVTKRTCFFFCVLTVSIKKALPVLDVESQTCEPWTNSWKSHFSFTFTNKEHLNVFGLFEIVEGSKVSKVNKFGVVSRCTTKFFWGRFVVVPLRKHTGR